MIVLLIVMEILVGVQLKMNVEYVVVMVLYKSVDVVPQVLLVFPKEIVIAMAIL